MTDSFSRSTRVRDQLHELLRDDPSFVGISISKTSRPYVEVRLADDSCATLVPDIMDGVRVRVDIVGD